MKANELRMGNYVDTPQGIKKVSNISVDSDCYFLTNEVKPIPLTEDWLNKFSFGSHFTSDPQDRNASKAHYLGDFKIHQPEEDFQNFIFGGDDFGILEVKYVNQLQNLYFALTGEELTLKKLKP